MAHGSDIGVATSLVPSVLTVTEDGAAGAVNTAALAVFVVVNLDPNPPGTYYYIGP